jgi:DHA1 family bicyclomycin/chloramphenicol resistance-like MFS transporter
MIRDIYGGHHAQRVMAMVTMMFGLAPAIAPIIGGWLEVWLGWRSIFVFLTLLAIFLFASCYWRLKESLPASARQPFELDALIANYLKLLRSVRFGLLSSSNAFNFAGFFLYVSSAPAVIYNLLGLGPNDFAWMFVPGILGIVFGAYVSGRLAGRVAPRLMVRYAYAVMLGAALYNVLYHASLPPALPWTVLAIMTYTTGMALAMPAMTIFMLDLFPVNRGLAASLQSAQQSFFSGLVAGLMSPFLSGTALGLACGMAAMLLCGVACWAAYAWMTNREDAR